MDFLFRDALGPKDVLFSFEYRLEGSVAFGVGTCVNLDE
jgi:hypothetical protein